MNKQKFKSTKQINEVYFSNRAFGKIQIDLQEYDPVTRTWMTGTGLFDSKELTQHLIKTGFIKLKDFT